MGTRGYRCLHRWSVDIQFDRPLFSARFPRCDFHLVEEFPLHGIIPTQPVSLAVPDLLCRLPNSINCKEQRQRARLPSGNTSPLVGRPHDGQAIRVLPLRVLEIFGSISPQQGGHRVICQAFQQQHAPTQRLGRNAGAADRVPGVMLAVAKGALPVLPGLPPVH